MAKLWERKANPMAIKKISELGFKGLTEILEQLSKKSVKAKTPSVRARRSKIKPDTKVVKPKAASTTKIDVKAKPKVSRTKGRKKVPTKTFTPIAGAGSRQPGRKIGEGVSTAGKGRATVKASSPPIKATRPTLKAKPKVSRTTAVTKKPSTALVPAPSTAVTKKPSTALVPVTGSRAVTGGGTKVGNTMKYATPTPQARIAAPKRSKVTPPVTPPSKINKGLLGTGIGLGGAILTAAMLSKKDKAQATPKSIPLPKSKPTPPSKPKVEPKVMPKSTTGTSPDKAKEGAAAKRTNISAGKNTGFGPKGNIFPSSSAERKELMKKYGGTGSAAAKAAARGTQGNLKASTAKRKAGGKVGIKQIKTKGSVALERVPAKKSSNPSARQVKGFGAARRPPKK